MAMASIRDSLAARTSLWNVGASRAGSDRMRKPASGIFFFGVGGGVMTWS